MGDNGDELGDEGFVKRLCVKGENGLVDLKFLI